MCALIRRLGEEDDITGCCGHMIKFITLKLPMNTMYTVNWLRLIVKFSLVTCMVCDNSLFCHVLTCPLY